LDPKGAVEAALFSSHELLRISEIAEKTGLSEEDIKAAIKKLDKEYDKRGSAIMVAKIGPGYILQLREEYVDYAGKFSERELSQATLKVAATIAYHQPIKQSELAQNLGPKVYDDVKILMDMDLIHGKPYGQTLELTTTKKFSEYFGIEGVSKEAIRKWIEKKQ